MAEGASSTNRATDPMDGSRLPMNPERLQRNLVFYSSLTTFSVMVVVIALVMLSGQYALDLGTPIDIFTVVALGASAWLAYRGSRPIAQKLLLCVSVPINLLAMPLLDGNGTWLALMLLTITPILWGILMRPWVCGLYTAALIGFFLIYLGPVSGTTITVDGVERTFASGITLSLLTTVCAIAGIVPRYFATKVYDSLLDLARQNDNQRRRYSDYAEMASDWHLEVDENGIVVDFFGFGNAEGEHWRNVLLDWEKDADVFWAAVEARKPYSGIKARLQIDGLERQVEFSGKPVFKSDGSFGGYRGIAHDITERMRAENELQHLARTDRLTGLWNRHAFNNVMSELKSDRSDARAAVIYIDLDRFKPLNDQFGHQAGDQVLTGIGQRLAEMSDQMQGLQPFRLGGDEFCCILDRGCSDDELEALAHRILALIEAPFSLSGRLIDITASVGAACMQSSRDIIETMERADAAVYQAKASGGGRIVLPVGAMGRHLDRKISIRRDLPSAISAGEIGLVYQPIYGAENYELRAVEALARWHHPHFGLISPAEFIETAETSRDIARIGQHVLRTACEETLQWMKACGQNIRLNVNVSPNEIVADGYFETLQQTLRETGFPPEQLELEITEHGILENISLSYDVLNRIRDAGVSIALDDFGTGYSSLSRLESLPVDRIKIDREFFLRAESNRKAQQVVGLLAGLSRIINVNVIAEGIETHDHLRFAEIVGFSEMQGYFLGRPGSLEQLLANTRKLTADLATLDAS